MNNAPRYQIFVSSTFRDLQEERQAVLTAILELNHIPAGMEIFPAADSTPWELIERIIEQSDYYVLIIGGRYGSLSEEGISYTEKEYNYAKEKGIPVLAFLHRDIGKMAHENVESDQSGRALLEQFRSKIEKGHHVKQWGEKFELKSYVMSALSNAAQSGKAIGWVRGSNIDISVLTQENYRMREEYDNLKEKIDTLEKENDELKKLMIHANKSDLLIDPKATIRLTIIVESGDEAYLFYKTITQETLFLLMAKELFLAKTLSKLIEHVMYGLVKHLTKKQIDKIQSLSKIGINDMIYNESVYVDENLMMKMVSQLILKKIIKESLGVGNYSSEDVIKYTLTSEGVRYYHQLNAK